MLTIWTHNLPVGNSTQTGVIGANLPLSAWKNPGEIATVLDDGTALIFDGVTPDSTAQPARRD